MIPAVHTIVFNHDGQKIYWTDQTKGEIRRSDPDGSNIKTIIDSLGTVKKMQLESINEKMYWLHFNGTGRIKRANFDGSDEEELYTGFNSTHYFTVDSLGQKNYFTDYIENQVLCYSTLTFRYTSWHRPF